MTLPLQLYSCFLLVLCPPTLRHSRDISILGSPYRSRHSQLEMSLSLSCMLDFSHAQLPITGLAFEKEEIPPLFLDRYSLTLTKCLRSSIRILP